MYPFCSETAEHTHELACAVATHGYTLTGDVAYPNKHKENGR